jgi:hypothetical protein
MNPKAGNPKLDRLRIEQTVTAPPARTLGGRVAATKRLSDDPQVERLQVLFAIDANANVTPTLPAGRVLDLYIDQGRTIVAGVLTEWKDPTLADGVDLTVPGGFTGLVVAANGAQNHDSQTGGTTNIGLSSVTATPWVSGQPRTVAAVGSTNGAGVFATFMRAGHLGGVMILQMGNGFIYSDAAVNVSASPTPWVIPLSIVTWKATPGAGQKPIVRVNGWQVDPAVITGTVGLDAGSTGLELGFRGDIGGIGWNKLIEEVHGWPFQTTLPQDQQIEAFLVAKFGVVGVSQWISDSAGFAMLCGNISTRCPFATTRLRTTATNLTLRVVNTASVLFGVDQVAIQQHLRLTEPCTRLRSGMVREPLV